ncbi:hypothetical protein HK101_000519 [Irineochytrium annulatum]|nr:hypothetical protein HK101_000519 [Irineochytrium annulatum]
MLRTATAAVNGDALDDDVPLADVDGDDAMTEDEDERSAGAKKNHGQPRRPIYKLPVRTAADSRAVSQEADGIDDEGSREDIALLLTQMRYAAQPVISMEAGATASDIPPAVPHAMPPYGYFSFNPYVPTTSHDFIYTPVLPESDLSAVACDDDDRESVVTVDCNAPTHVNPLIALDVPRPHSLYTDTDSPLPLLQPAASHYFAEPIFPHTYALHQTPFPIPSLQRAAPQIAPSTAALAKSAPSTSSAVSSRPRNHACPHPGCRKLFYRSQDLLRHRSTHMLPNERPHACPNGCGRRFGRADAAVRHARTSQWCGSRAALAAAAAAAAANGGDTGTGMGGAALMMASPEGGSPEMGIDRENEKECDGDEREVEPISPDSPPPEAVLLSLRGPVPSAATKAAKVSKKRVRPEKEGKEGKLRIRFVKKKVEAPRSRGASSAPVTPKETQFTDMDAPREMKMESVTGSAVGVM